MLLTITLGIVASCLTVAIGYLGLHVALHPSEAASIKRRRKWLFIMLSFGGLIITGIQSWQNYRDQVRFNAFTAAVQRGSALLQEISGRCITSSDLDKCFTQIGTLTARLGKLNNSQPQVAGVATQTPSPSRTQTADNARPTPTATPLLSEATPGERKSSEIQIRHGGGAQCVDPSGRPVAVGCVDADCTAPCITVLDAGPS